MKKWIFLSLALILGLSCDKVDDPLKKNPGTGSNNNGDVVKKVLLEEFTGVRCNNCPTATEKAKSLTGLYGDQLILVAIHASDLAQPDSKHPVDFTTTEGDEIYNDFNLFGVPVGFVDRTGYSNQSIIKLSGQWGPAIEDQLEQPAQLKITLSEESYDSTSDSLNVQLSIEALEDIETGKYMLSIFLLESGIVAPQTLPDKSTDDNYVHDHVLRTSFNSTYGQEISTTGFVAGEELDFNQSVIIENSWVKENCEVVAFVYRESDFEVLQSEKLEL